MRTIKTDFKRSGKYFVVSMEHLFEAVLMSAIYGLAYLYHGMNGRFGKHKLNKPYVYVWRFLTWGTFVWVVFTYMFVPFFNWWDRVVSFLNYVIWG